MKAIVTGGAGFIGSHIVRALAADGHEVHVIDNYAGGRFSERIVEGATYHEGSVLDTGLLGTVFDGAEAVFHLAALPRVQFSIEYPVESDQTNVGGTVAVLHAAQKAGVRRVVYSASSSAYGDQEKLPLTETMEVRPLSPYALQKHVGEQYCALFSEIYGLETVSLRYFNVYGPGADPHGAYALVIAKFIEQRKNGEPMTVAGDGTNTRDYTHVRDVVRANLLASSTPKVGKGEVINIGGCEQWSVNQVAQMIGGPTVQIEARLEPKATQADTTRAQELLDWEAEVPFAEGIDELKRLAGIA
jgi:UDP-glucose 4-epimerase